MKNTLFFFMLIGLLASCRGDKKQTTTDSPAIAPKTDDTQQLIAEFKPMIPGLWLKISYIDKVLRTKSPAAAVDEVENLTLMYIDTNKIEGDSLVVEGGWGNHEGGDVRLYFKRPENNNSAVTIDGGALGYSIEHGDTILTVYRNDEKHKGKTTMLKFRRVSLTKGESLGYWMDHQVNKGLVAGNYTLVDSVGASMITFSADGKVKGLADFKTYYINIDLNMEPMDNLDDIGFKGVSGSYTWYSFKIDADTLKLYKTRPNADSTLSVLDDLKYKLVRRK